MHDTIGPTGPTGPTEADGHGLTGPNANGPNGGTAQSGTANPTQDMAMAKAYLARLDPNAERFTFQTFDDNPDRKSKALCKALVKILHGTLEECWPELVRLNNLGAGIFITVNATDFRGRATHNIVKVRALFADADGKQQTEQAITVIKECGA